MASQSIFSFQKAPLAQSFLEPSSRLAYYLPGTRSDTSSEDGRTSPYTFPVPSWYKKKDPAPDPTAQTFTIPDVNAFASAPAPSSTNASIWTTAATLFGPQPSSSNTPHPIPTIPNSTPVDLPPPQEMAGSADVRELAAHLTMLKPAASQQEQQNELASTPVFARPVLEHSNQSFSQYGLLAGNADLLDRIAESGKDAATLSIDLDPRIYFNISTPSSAFICGSQGSGKSHTLSCLLENCLLKSTVSKLENPLAGLVFHYDSFTSDLRGTPCEAAHLSSNPNIRVRVLCSPSNIQTMKRTYTGMNVEVEPLRINQNDLNTKRMLDLMAVNTEGRLPLYLHEITRILREMRVIQQETNGSFNYAVFKRAVDGSPMTREQLAPLTQRLDTLESFMPKSQTGVKNKPAVKGKAKRNDVGGNDWNIKPGTLTIVDLSCPCVTAEAACALFNMCLSLFLEQKTMIGRIIALDEAHKYMNTGSEATALTNTLLSSIRLQRHLGTRVLISTQEPSISPKLLDLCSITIVHRFTSPDWLKCLRSHLAALDNDDGVTTHPKSMLANTFNKIVTLKVGEALLFAPSAIIDVKTMGDPNSGAPIVDLRRLGTEYLRVRIRDRLTADGGRSVLALGSKASPFVKASASTQVKPISQPAAAVGGFNSTAPPTPFSFGVPASVSLFGSKPANTAQQPNSTTGAAQNNSAAPFSIFGGAATPTNTTEFKATSVPSALSSLNPAKSSNITTTSGSALFGSKPASGTFLFGNFGVANSKENNPTSSSENSHNAPIKVEHNDTPLFQDSTNQKASKRMFTSDSPIVIKGSLKVSTTMLPPPCPSTKWGFQPAIEKDPTPNSKEYNIPHSISFLPT